MTKRAPRYEGWSRCEVNHKLPSEITDSHTTLPLVISNTQIERVHYRKYKHSVKAIACLVSRYSLVSNRQ